MFDMFDEENTKNSENNYSNSSSYDDSNSNDSAYSSNASYSNSVNEESNIKKKGFVISVGGSVFIGEKPYIEKIIDFCNVINELSNEFNIVLVVGGGKTARNYIECAKELGANNFEQDSLGIAISRVNAMLFTYNIRKAKKTVCTNFRTVCDAIEEKKIPIFGGMFEGQTTDAVSALLAEKLGFDFVNLSNVDGVYDSDPNKNDNAKLFNELSFNDMNLLLQGIKSKPGQNIFVDLQAANIITRSKIISFFVNGDNLENFKDCLLGNNFVGTIVHNINNIIKNPVKKKRKITRKFSASDLRKPRKVSKDDDVIDPKQIDFG
jgi:uridylate kinase